MEKFTRTFIDPEKQDEFFISITLENISLEASLPVSTRLALGTSIRDHLLQIRAQTEDYHRFKNNLIPGANFL